MKVVRVHYRGNQRSVFVYDGMSSAEVASLLRAVVAQTLSLPAGEREPRILALRQTSTGAVIPLSQAIQHIDTLPTEVEIIDDRYREGEQQQQLQQTARPQTARVGQTELEGRNAAAWRPQTSPGSNEAGLPTPILRHASAAGGSSLDTPAAYGLGHGTWGYRSSQQPPVQRQNYVTDSADESPVDSAASSPRFSPAEGPASPALSAASSQASWEEDGRAAGSGVLVIMSYPELLDVLTGHQLPNLNNGTTPQVLREGLPHLYVLAVVRPGSDACEAIFPAYEKLAASRRYSSLIFLITEDVHLAGTALDVPVENVPTFQFFLQGHLLGQVVNPTQSQLAAMCRQAHKLCEDNPAIEVDASGDDEEEEEEEEEEPLESSEYDSEAECAAAVEQQRRSAAAARSRAARPSSYSLGEALDARGMRMSDAERREVFGDVEDEEARWEKLLQASPRAKPLSNQQRQQQRQQAWDEEFDAATASPSPSEGSEDDGGAFAPNLVIRGQKIPLHAPTRQQLLEAQRVRSAAASSAAAAAAPVAARSRNPEHNLRDWSAYTDFTGAESSDGDVNESNYDDSEAEAEVREAERQLSEQARRNAGAARAQQQQQQQQQQQSQQQHELSGHKRKTHPPVASSSDEGSDDECGFARDFARRNALTDSPVLVGRGGPSSPNGVELHAPVGAAGRSSAAAARGNSNADNVLMSPSEALAIERVLLREQPDVRAAFAQCPALDTFVNVFIRLVHEQIQPKPTQQSQESTSAAAAAPAASAVNTSSAEKTTPHGVKRKTHSVSYLGQEPRYKLRHVTPTPAQLRAEEQAQQAAHEAAMRELRRKLAKRPNQALYPQMSDSDGEGEERAAVVPHHDSFAAAGSSQQHQQSLSRAEQAAAAELNAQQDRFAQLEQEFSNVQNEIFSRTVHDLHSTEIITSGQLEILVRLWTQTESGSNAIRKLMHRFEQHGDEVEFMFKLVQLVARFEAGEEVAPSDDGSSGGEDDAEGARDSEQEDGGSPLASDEERQYREIMEQGGSSDDALDSSDVGASPSSSTQSSPQRGARQPSAPQSSPVGGAVGRPGPAQVSAIEEQEASLESNLTLVSQLGDAHLLSPSQVQRTQQYLQYGHPLVQAAFLAFSYNHDVEDLLDTLQEVLAAKNEGEQKQTAQAPVAQPKPQARHQSQPQRPSQQEALLTSDDVLSLLPPWIVEEHRGSIESLVDAQDSEILSAWEQLRKAVATQRGPALAKSVEVFVLTVEKRALEHSDKQSSAAKPAPAQANGAGRDDAEIADALQIASVLHTGGVFDDEACAVLFGLIVRDGASPSASTGTPSVLAAFETARRTEEWDTLHTTLVDLLAKHSGDKSATHALLPIVRNQAAGQISVQTVQQIRALLAGSKAAPSSSKSTPQRAAAAAAASNEQQQASSSSVPSAWSRMVKAFSRTLESLQSSGALSDAAALKLIELFQQRNLGVVSACQVFELDGSEAEFADSLKAIADEHTSQGRTSSPRTQRRLLARATPEEAGLVAASQPQSAQKSAAAPQAKSARERLVQSFAQRVQDVHDLERSGVVAEEEEEDDEEDQEGSDAVGDSDEVDGSDDGEDAALTALLNKSDDAEWTGEDVEALYSKVMAMQNELQRLKQMQRAEAQAAGEEGRNDSQDEEEEEDEDLEEEEEDQEEEDQEEEEEEEDEQQE